MPRNGFNPRTPRASLMARRVPPLYGLERARGRSCRFPHPPDQPDHDEQTQLNCFCGLPLLARRAALGPATGRRSHGWRYSTHSSPRAPKEATTWSTCSPPMAAKYTSRSTEAQPLYGANSKPRLEVDGRDLRPKPLKERRRVLEHFEGGHGRRQWA